MSHPPLADTEVSAAVRLIRARMVASYRKNGPEVGPDAYVRTSVQVAGYEQHLPQLTSALLDVGVLRLLGTGVPTTSDTFRYLAVRVDPDSTWIGQQIPGHAAAKWKWAARRRHLSCIASAALTADRSFALRAAAEAACGDPHQAQLVAAAAPPDPTVVRVLIALADGPPLTGAEALTVALGVALPVAG